MSSLYLYFLWYSGHYFDWEHCPWGFRALFHICNICHICFIWHIWNSAVSHLPSVICHLSFVICHLPSIICHPSSVICYPSSVICHPSSVIRHPSSVIRLTIYLFSAHLCSILSELDSEDLHLVIDLNLQNPGKSLNVVKHETSALVFRKVTKLFELKGIFAINPMH